MAKQKWDVVLPPYNVIEVGFRAGDQVVDWGHKMLRASEAYSKTKGEGTIIFILDTAGEFTHPDLADREIVALRKNFSTAQGLADVHGHGTHCAGIAAASDNNIGVIGIAPAANLAAVKVLNDQGSGTWSGIISGIRYVADLVLGGTFANHKKLISMSLGGSEGSPELLDAIRYAIGKQCFVLAAAGNAGNNAPVGYPGAYEEVITIGSIGKTENPSSFTSSGAAVDLAAPGEGVYSTHKNGTYALLSGTSMATPQVSGLCALVLGAHNVIKTQQILETFLEKNAKDIYLPGEDLLTGAGLPVITNYFKDPDPDPDPDPPVQREKRGVILPFAWEDTEAPVVKWRRLEEKKFESVFVKSITFRVTTREMTEAVHDRMKNLFEEYARNRHYIMPSLYDLQDVGEWVARFFRMLNTNIGEYTIEKITVKDDQERTILVEAASLVKRIAAARAPVAAFKILPI